MLIAHENDRRTIELDIARLKDKQNQSVDYWFKSLIQRVETPSDGVNQDKKRNNS
jgi:hypothetical protein